MCEPGGCDDVVKVLGNGEVSEMMDLFQTTDKKVKQVDDMSIHDLEIELMKWKLDYLQSWMKDEPWNEDLLMAYNTYSDKLWHL